MQQDKPVLGPISIDEANGKIIAPHPYSSGKFITIGTLDVDSLGVSYRKYFSIAHNSFLPMLTALGNLASLADSRVNGDDNEPNTIWERTLLETQELIKSINGGIDLAIIKSS